MTTLHEIHLAIDARVHGIRENRPDWPCSKGCDTCCRSLADIPRLTEAEWALLKEGLTALPAERLAEITRNTAAFAEQTTRPVVCPMLDQATGDCPVYAYRPVACRSYGFYVQRDKGMYCGDIEARVSDGSLADVVWGNHDAVDRELGGQGEAWALTEWFERWRCEGR